MLGGLLFLPAVLDRQVLHDEPDEGCVRLAALVRDLLGVLQAPHEDALVDERVARIVFRYLAVNREALHG